MELMITACYSELCFTAFCLAVCLMMYFSLSLTLLLSHCQDVITGLKLHAVISGKMVLFCKDLMTTNF